MARLFLFGIGGTGSRVIRSLSMILASGVDINIYNSPIDSIVPLMLDPDQGNGDLNRTNEILNLYKEIGDEVGWSDGFFRTKISAINQIAEEESGRAKFSYTLDNVASQKFEEFIGYQGFDVSNKAFLDLFYSKANLDSNMDVGFKGNPNIGSVVLNHFITSSVWKQFDNSFQSGDQVFIVNSIFGGTGAAGFPILLNNMRQSKNNIVRDCKIGVLTVLPYFQLDEEGEINSLTFLDKTKAALKYYNKNIIDKNLVNSIYFIGNSNIKNKYENNSGGGTQKNHAHFIELAGSLAILDYLKEGITNHSNIDKQTSIKEFGIKEISQPLSFSNLGGITSDELLPLLSKFHLLNVYFNLGLKLGIKEKRPWLSNNLVKNLFSDSFFSNSNLMRFLIYFAEWEKELVNNEISFNPFNFDQSFSNALDFIPSVPTKYNWRFGSKEIKNLKYIDGACNYVLKEDKILGKNELDNFLKLFNSGVGKILNETLKKG
jgi:hypothetical protein